jgi:hypothetical protein
MTLVDRGEGPLRTSNRLPGERSLPAGPGRAWLSSPRGLGREATRARPPRGGDAPAIHITRNPDEALGLPVMNIADVIGIEVDETLGLPCGGETKRLFASSPLRLFASSPLRLFASSPLRLFASRISYPTTERILALAGSVGLFAPLPASQGLS